MEWRWAPLGAGTVAGARMRRMGEGGRENPGEDLRDGGLYNFDIV